MPARRDLYTGRHEFLHRGWGPLEDDDKDLPRQISGPANQSLANESMHVSQLFTDHFHLWEQGSGNYHMGFSGFEFIRGIEADAYITDPIPFPLPSPSYRNTKFERHFRNVERIRRRPDGTLDESKWFAAQTFDGAARWIEGNRTRKDFFLHIDSFTPHEPYDPPERLVKLFDPRGYDVPEYFPIVPYTRAERSGLTPDQIRHSQALYAANVVYVDECLGRFLDTLDRHDLWKDTLVILTTDHGTYNGSRGLLGKMQTHQFDPVAHIPLIIAHPDFAHGKRRDQLVQLVDLYSTSLAALGCAIPRDRHGLDLLPVLLDAKAKTREFAVAGVFGHSVTIADGRWVLHQRQPEPSNTPLHWYSHHMARFIWYNLGPFEDGRREVTHKPHPGVTWLSDRKNDPNELRNLAEECPEELKRMQEALWSVIISTSWVLPLGDKKIRLGLN